MWLFITVGRPTILGEVYTKECAKNILEQVKQKYKVLEYVWIEEGLRICIDFAPERKVKEN